MTKLKTNTFLIFLLLALAGSFSQALIADISIPFEAVYQINIDGKPRMETRMQLVRQGEQWLLSNDGKGTKGLAKMLGAQSHERSIGIVYNNQFQTIEYSQSSKIFGNEKQWSASFNRENNEIKTSHKDGVSQFESPPDTVDPLSLTLNLRYFLSIGETEFSLNVVDETGVSQHDFIVGETEILETALGCISAVPVTRVRENSKRYSSGWYAESLDFMPVRLLHGKHGGREFEMRITWLSVDGKSAALQTDCPS